MSLYTLSTKDAFQPLDNSVELRIEESVNVDLLAALAGATADDVVRRIANDNAAFVAYIKDVPVAFGWMARGKAFIGELNHELILPVGHRYLWNFRTLESFRGLGIYPALIQHIIAIERPQADRFWIIHAPENDASLKGIRKAGFKYVGTLYNTGHNTIIEATASAFEYHDLLLELDVKISNDQPVSCWNCSSPYLKKRKDVCCCVSNGKSCIGHNVELMPA